MARDWQPGDVAMVEAGCWANRKIALRLDEGWSHINGVSLDEDGIVSPIRPLVVIDPEDREQVERLINAWHEQQRQTGKVAHERMGDALRSLIEPPRPDEPTGLGAVVEDAEGTRWVRIAEVDYPWTRSMKESRLPNELFCWTEIKAVRVLSDGVSA